MSTGVTPYYLAYILPLLTLVGYNLGGLWNYSSVVFTFVLVPLLDLIVAKDETNPTKEEEKILEKQLKWRIATWLWAPQQIALLIWAFYLVATKSFTKTEYLGFILGVGINGGLGINVSHELLHKRESFEKFLAWIILMTVSYMHFFVEHRDGHHLHVATPNDPATAKFGENFYTFWPRTVFGSFLSAWKIECKRVQKLYGTMWTIYNHMLWYITLPISFAVTFCILFGNVKILSFFAWQSIVAFTLLELVNYIEHYGLQRKEKSPGKYEPVTPYHSWNAPFRVTNYFLFKLQRHSDHHAYPVRRYQILRSWKESPQMPTGYAGMILLALVPPIWFWMMDPLVTKINKEQNDCKSVRQ